MPSTLGIVASHIKPSSYVITVAGSTDGYAEGQGTAAQFSNPKGVAVDGNGTVFVADVSNHRIRKISPSGLVSTFAGSGIAGWADGNGTSARFSSPHGVAVDGSGNVYVGDTGNNRVRKIDSSGNVTTLAGNGTNAVLYYPEGVAVDGSGNVYVAARAGDEIHKISPNGVKTIMAGSTDGYADGQGTAAKFSSPKGVAVDGSGNVYVVDYGNHRIRKISPSGLVSTFAGSGTAGFANGNGTSASFSFPSGIAVDLNGNVYVADTNNHRIRKIDSSGNVTTLAGLSTGGSTDGSLAIAQFNLVLGIALDASGNVYVADSGDRIRKIVMIP